MSRLVAPHRSRRPWLALATLVVVLAAFLGLAARVALSLGEPDLLEQKIAGAERYLYYRLTATRGPRFELSPDDTAIRLVTHAVAPPADSYDPEREIEYGVRVVIDLADGETWTRDIYTRSRQSKARWTGTGSSGGARGIWLDENTFLPGSTLQLTDDRVLVIALPALRPAVTTARVTLLGEVREGFVRGYAPAPRTNVARYVRDLPDAERARIAASVGHLPWDRIHDPEELATLRFAERRLSAKGSDYATRMLWTTGFRLRGEVAIERGLLVTAARDVAVNVVGPARITVSIGQVSSPADARLARPVTATVTVALVGEHAAPPPVTLAVPPAGEPTTREISVPSGAFTMVLTSSAAVRVKLSTAGDTAVALGGMPGTELVPDEQITAAFFIDREAPITIDLEGPPDVLAHVLRIDLRPLASEPTNATAIPAAIASSVAGDLVIETLDDAGATVATTSVSFERETSRFEIARLPGRLVANVCEPVSVRFVVPAGGRAVRIGSDRPALVQVQTPLAISPPPDRVAPPYDAVALPPTLHWRYARFIDRGWFALRPRQVASERIAGLVSQARLEPRELPSAEAHATAIALPGERQTVIERIAAEDAPEVIRRWGAGNYTRLVSGRPTQLDLGKLPTRPTIRYRAAAQIGTTARIEIDGVPHDEPVQAARGSWRLDGTGVRTVRVEATGVELLVDRPPIATARAELYALRTVSPLVNGRVRATIIKRGAQKQNVNIALYTRSRISAATVRVTIDGGAPRRVPGVALTTWTVAERTVAMPAADRPPTLGFADRDGGTLYPRRLVVALGDDVPAGPHTIEIAVAGEAAWARLFTLDDAPPAPRARQWRETEEETP